MAGDGHPRQMTILRAQARETELGLRFGPCPRRPATDAGGSALVFSDGEPGTRPPHPSERFVHVGSFRQSSRPSPWGCWCSARRTLRRSTTKYCFELKSEQVIDLSVFSQPNQVVTLDLKAWVATTLTDSAGGKVVHVIVDSLRATSSAPQLTGAMADSAKGGMIHGFVDPSGRVKNLTSTTGGQPAPHRSAGNRERHLSAHQEGRQRGRSLDRHDGDREQGGGNNTTVKLNLNYTAAGTETAAGVPALKVTATSASVVSGTAENPWPAPWSSNGTGVGGGTFWIGTDGRFLGGDLSSTIDQKLTITGAPAPIPVKVTQQLKVTALL